MMAIQPKETNTRVKNVIIRKWRVFIVEENVEMGLTLSKNRTVPPFFPKASVLHPPSIPLAFTIELELDCVDHFRELPFHLFSPSS